MVTKLVTIGIPFFNNERTLRFAISSTIKQTYKNLEILLIDDGSQDGSLKIAHEFANIDKRIKVISDGTNKGLISRLNQIISIAQGEYIARMDADDLMDLERIEKQVQILNNQPEVDVVTTGMISMTNDFKAIGKRCCVHTTPDMYQVFKNGDGILHASMVTRANWSKKNIYLEGFSRAEDRELFTRTLKNTTYINIPEPLYFYMDVQNMTLKKYLDSYKSERKALVKNWKESITLFQMMTLLVRSYLKSIVVGLFFLFGKQEHLMKNNNQNLSENERQAFQKRILESKN